MKFGSEVAAGTLHLSQWEPNGRGGALALRSGLVLTSSFRGFGGLSGLRLDAKGERFISISDHGSWFTARIVMDTLITAAMKPERRCASPFH
jgi:hypothetical protein